MMRIFARFTLFSLLAVPSFLLAVPSFRNPGAKVYLKYTDDIVNEFVKEMKEKYDLHCTGDGGGFVGSVNKISISFVSYQHASVGQARELQVLVNQALVEKIRNHKNIQPYLKETPFPLERVVVSIAFRNKDDSLYRDGSVAFVYQVKKHIVFSRSDPSTKKLIDIKREPYEEALRIVKDSQKTPTSEK